VQLVHGGEDYFARLETLINAAEHEIHLQTYIFEDDATGKRIAQALINAATKGVEVFLVIDAYGSKGLGRLGRALEAAGVKMHYFGRVYTGADWAWGRRLHHKIFVADRCHVLVGGVNISNHYSGMDGHLPWLDYALFFEGETGKDIFKICKQIFAQWFVPKRRRFRLFQKFAHSKHKTTIQLMQNDWLRGKNNIVKSYIKAIKAAKTEVIVANSYFLPGGRFRAALKNAAKRGVRVKVILPGISDVPLVKQAIHYLYAYLLRNGVEIYEWQPSILHAKIACVDGQWSTIGSYNLNYLSAYASIEFNINVLDAEFCSTFQIHLNQMLTQQCVKVVDKNYYHLQNPFIRFWLWLSYLLIRFSEGLLITFPGQRLFNRNKYA
jgi:cardiolipin synthase A/B